MRINIEINELDLKKLVMTYLNETFDHGVNIKPEDVQILVKSKQNYKAEWETAAFKAIVDKDVSP